MSRARTLKKRAAPKPRGRLSRSVRRQGTARKSGPGLLYFGILISLTVAFSLAYVWLRMQRIGLAYDLSLGQQREQRLDVEHRRLIYRLATLKEPERLEHIAREELGLSVPRPGQVIVLAEEGAH